LDQSSDQEAWDQLERVLREADSLRVTDPRAGVKSVVEGLLHFLYQKRPQWTAEGIHRPLVDLLAGLIDLDKGHRAALLTPTTFQHRHHDAALLQMMQGHAIFAIEQLVSLGESVTAAKDQVARVWNKYSGEPREASTIKSWYDRRDKMPKGDLAFDVLINLRVLWDPENLDRPSAEFVKYALREAGLTDDLNDHLPHTGAGILKFLKRTLTAIKRGHQAGSQAA
jgi:hypothetical protein